MVTTAQLAHVAAPKSLPRSLPRSRGPVARGAMCKASSDNDVEKSIGDMYAKVLRMKKEAETKRTQQLKTIAKSLDEVARQEMRALRQGQGAQQGAEEATEIEVEFVDFEDLEVSSSIDA